MSGTLIGWRAGFRKCEGRPKGRSGLWGLGEATTEAGAADFMMGSESGERGLRRSPTAFCRGWTLRAQSRGTITPSSRLTGLSV